MPLSLSAWFSWISSTVCKELAIMPTALEDLGLGLTFGVGPEAAVGGSLLFDEDCFDEDWPGNSVVA